MTAPAAPPPVPDVPRPLVKRHHWIVRLTHWLTFVVLLGVITSGLQIYTAYARFGERGGPYYQPNPFQDHGFPEWSRLGHWLAGALNWHFALAWLLVGGGLLYVSYLAASGEWRSLLFRPRDVRGAVEMQKYYLRIRKDHPPQGKHNPLQKLAYSSIVRSESGDRCCSGAATCAARSRCRSTICGSAKTTRRKASTTRCRSSRTRPSSSWARWRSSQASRSTNRRSCPGQ